MFMMHNQELIQDLFSHFAHTRNVKISFRAQSDIYCPDLVEQAIK